jgi:fructokinase
MLFEVVALGELLIDFIPVQSTPGEIPCYIQHPGGAPANVAVTLAKLGKRAAFIGKVGDDQFGRFLADVLNENHVDTKSLMIASDVNTTLAFVHLDEKGDRSFSFYRQPGADMMLTEKEVDFKTIRSGQLFHFGSVSLTDQPARTATLKAAEYARKHGIFVTYDPNFRPLLWKNLSEAREVILKAANYANLLKISEEELLFLTDTDDLNEGSKFLADTYDVELVLITLGEKGCFYRLRSDVGIIPGFQVRTVDTTGAGDAFLGGFLASMFDMLGDPNNIITVSRAQLEAMLQFANAVGALTTTAKGAISAIPSREEIFTFLGSIE